MKRKVRVTGPGVKLNNIWCYINEEAVIDEKQYKENEKYVEVIEEIEEPKTEPENPINPEGEQNDGTDSEGENSGENKNETSEDEELEALKEKAKELGIKNAHNMKKETLIAKIEETKAGEGQNPEGE